jgi:hypothetical protein
MTGMQSVPELDVIVVGAGQAGLATGYHLKRVGLRYEVLDGNSRVGDSWRQRFDTLMLFTPRSYSALPGLAVPGDPRGFPGKDEIADYLEAYAGHFAIPTRLDSAARSLETCGANFRVTTSQGVQIESRAVVIATGAFPDPEDPGHINGLLKRCPPVAGESLSQAIQPAGRNRIGSRGWCHGARDRARARCNSQGPAVNRPSSSRDAGSNPRSKRLLVAR